MNRNKKSIRKREDLVSLKLISNKNFEKMFYLFEELKKESKVPADKIISELLNDPKIPLSIFNETLSGLETITKYLKENLNLSYKAIAKLLNRSEKTIWQAHFFSKKKFPQKLEVKETEFLIPVDVLSNRSLSILESIVIYLKDYLNLKYYEIASLLKRDHSTIWTVYKRGKSKQKNEQS